MGITKEAFVDLQEKFTKVKKLIEEDSKLDPESEPYLSKYAARQVLISMRAGLEKLIDQSGYSDKLQAMLGTVWLHLGMIAIDTEEFATGETNLNKTVTLVEEHSLEPEFILIMLNALNHLGLLWSHRDEAEKSKQYLEKAQKMYADFKALNISPVTFSALFKSVQTDEEDSYVQLEKVHTLTLYYLAQIYGTLKDALRSAVYCHITLKRQLQFNDNDYIEWALNAATLSQVFMEKNGFKQARHHLAAASHILSEYSAQLNETASLSEEHEAKLEIFRHRSADVARCWAKYGLLLLSTSKDRLMSETHGDITSTLTSDLAQLHLSSDNTVSAQDLSDLVFPTLDLSAYENQVTDQFVLIFDDARAVFLNILSWLTEAHLYYSLENHASDYAQIVQDMSQMYKSLAFFEENPDRQCKMHKRRIDLMEHIVKELNPTYYMQICRQLWYELGDTYFFIMEIKMVILQESTERPTPHALQKINWLLNKSILNFSLFIDSVKDASTNEMPEKISDDLEGAVLRAYFKVGVMHNKYITADKNQQIENTQRSLDYFIKIVNYCDKYENACESLSGELNLCREMVTLLPAKIMKLSQLV